MLHDTFCGLSLHNMSTLKGTTSCDSVLRVTRLSYASRDVLSAALSPCRPDNNRRLQVLQSERSRFEKRYQHVLHCWRKHFGVLVGVCASSYANRDGYQHGAAATRRWSWLCTLQHRDGHQGRSRRLDMRLHASLSHSQRRDDGQSAARRPVLAAYALLKIEMCRSCAQTCTGKMN